MLTTRFSPKTQRLFSSYGQESQQDPFWVSAEGNDLQNEAAECILGLWVPAKSSPQQRGPRRSLRPGREDASVGNEPIRAKDLLQKRRKSNENARDAGARQDLRLRSVPLLGAMREHPGNAPQSPPPPNLSAQEGYYPGSLYANRSGGFNNCLNIYNNLLRI